MGASEEDDIFREFDFKCEEQEDGLYTLGTFVHIVSQEQVVGGLDVTVEGLVTGCSKGLE